MHVISKSALRAFWKLHPDNERMLSVWFKLVKATAFRDFEHVKGVFPSADYVAPFTVFDIGGNNWRVVTVSHYNAGRLYIRHVFTHPEYDQWCKISRSRKQRSKQK